MTYGPDVPAPGRPDMFAADEIVLYGIKLNADDNSAALDLTQRLEFGPPPEETILRMQVWRRGRGDRDLQLLRGDQVTIAAVYAYAFQGRCFRPEKVKIYAFSYPDRDMPAVGCGFDERGAAPGAYLMWRLSAKTPLMELSACLDTAETLILEAATPGKRSPNAYSSRMEVGHRGGRVTNM